MKRIAFTVGLIVLAFGVTILAQTRTESVEQELIKLEKQWADAVIKLDLAFLDGIWADDYAWTASDGNFWSKAQTLESLKSGKIGSCH